MSNGETAFTNVFGANGAEFAMAFELYLQLSNRLRYRAGMYTGLGEIKLADQVLGSEAGGCVYDACATGYTLLEFCSYYLIIGAVCIPVLDLR